LRIGGVRSIVAGSAGRPATSADKAEHQQNDG
jgi:hypothetical protein